jgi:DNA-binding GntR family transcriptional regulator
VKQPSDELVPRYKSLTQIIMESLRQRIFEGEYAPGMRLNITDLAHAFGASAVPVREALRNLEAEGLIEFRLNRGVVVRNLSHEVVRELFLIRVPLESLAASEAARLATDEDIAELDSLVAKMEKNIGADSWHKSHRHFHERLCQISRLPRLIQLVDSLRGQMRPYSKVYLQDRDHVLLAQQEHREMVDCLRRRDPDRIARIIHAHLERPARMAMAAFEAGTESAEDVGNGARKKPSRRRGQKARSVAATP